MRYPHKKVFGKTYIGWLNFLILQWFFIRLQANVHEYLIIESWQIRVALPMTGWYTDYIPKNWYFNIYRLIK